MIDKLLSAEPIADEYGIVDGVCCVVCLVHKGTPCKGLEPGQVHEARKLSLAMLRFPIGMPMQGSQS